MTDAIADEPISDLVHPRTAEALALAEAVRRFLRVSEARDRATLRALAAPGFTARFPGDMVHPSVDAWLDSSAGRFQWVRKGFERFDVAVGAAPGSGVVHVHGRLYGRFADGTGFDGTRFIDRFELVAGRIADQQVWNDLGVATLTPP